MKYYDVVKAISSGEKIFNISLRVTYYCRVSTDSDVQLNSLENQLEYYDNYIKNKCNWTYIPGYVEEGFSGTRADKRPSFMKMIRDAKLNKFDLIITKDVSRFARDLEDSIHYIRLLREYGVGILFENQSLNTFDSNSELTLNILFNIAQEESKKISSSVKFGFRKAISKGHVLGSSNITGYKKDNCKLVIVKEEAKLIKRIFELYASSKYGFYSLSKKLSNEGYLNKKGNPYDKDTLKKIIQNPKYKGYYRARTYEILDYRTKRRKKYSKEEQIIYKCVDGTIPSIVSEELWDKANEVLDKRTVRYKNNNYWSGGKKYPLSSKVYCLEHDTFYQRSTSRSLIASWSCSMYLHFGLEACKSPIILESDLYNVLLHIMNIVIKDKEKIIDNMLNIYKSIDLYNDYDIDIMEIEKQIKKIEDKKLNTLDLVFDRTISKKDVKVQFQKYGEEINKLTKEKEIIEEQKRRLTNVHTNIKDISKVIKEELNGGIIDNFTRRFVDKINVSKIDNDRNNLQLNIYLNILGEDKIILENEIYIGIKNTYTYNVYINGRNV